MPDERESQLVCGNPCTVVADSNRRLARTANVDVDAARPGVECVLHELFDHGSRPLDHLAGGDRVRDFGREHLDQFESLALSW